MEKVERDKRKREMLLEKGNANKFIFPLRCHTWNLLGSILVHFSIFSMRILNFTQKILSLTGFVAAHTLPVLYERHEDQVDRFVYKVLDQLRHNYRKLDSSVLSRIPKGKFRGKKAD